MADPDQLDMNNPAQRLLHLVLTVQPASADHQIRNVWAKAFDIKENDHPELLRNLTACIELIDLVCSELDKTPYKCKFFRRKQALLAGFAHPNLAGKWNTVKAQFDATTVRDLEAIGDVLAVERPTSGPTQDELDRLRQALQDAFDEVAASALDPELQRFVLDQLSELLYAINRYRIVGPDGLRRAVARAVSELKSKPTVWERLRSNEAANKALKVIHWVALAASLTADVHQLTDSSPPTTIEIHQHYDVPVLPDWPTPHHELMPPSDDAKEMEPHDPDNTA